MTTISHARAVDLGSLAPAFELDPAEQRALRTHLAGCHDCAHRVARLRTDLTAIRGVDPPVPARLHDRLQEIAVTAPRTGPSPVGIILVLALLAMVVIAGSAGAGAYLASRQAARPDAPAPSAAAPTVRWRTEVAALSAGDISVTQDGARLVGAAMASVTSDPGDRTRWTLEASWTEQGRRQRLNLYFKSDGSTWWIDELRTWDSGAKGGRDVTFHPREETTTPVGQAFNGSLDLASDGGASRVRLTDLTIAVRPADLVNEPLAAAPRTLIENGDPAVNGDPFGSGGPLRCSGILQLQPKQAEARLLFLGYPLSWRIERSTGSMTGYADPSRTAPDSGYISGTAVGTSGELIVFVQDPDRPMEPAATLPPGCSGG